MSLGAVTFSKIPRDSRDNHSRGLGFSVCIFYASYCILCYTSSLSKEYRCMLLPSTLYILSSSLDMHSKHIRNEKFVSYLRVELLYV